MIQLDTQLEGTTVFLRFWSAYERLILNDLNRCFLNGEVTAITNLWAANWALATKSLNFLAVAPSNVVNNFNAILFLI